MTRQENLMFQFTNISILILIATAVNIFTAYTAWQRRNTKGGVYFATAMTAFVFWTLAAALDYAAIPIPLKVFFAKLEMAGYLPALSLMTAFTLVYAGREALLEKFQTRFLLVFIPASSILLTWTNELHGWVWTGFMPQQNNIVDFEHGPGFLWISLSGYLLIAIIVLNMVQVAITGAGLLRRQASLMLLALIVPITGNLFYLFNILNTPGVDWSSITFTISGVLFLFALYGSRFMEIVPTARNVMIDEMEDGILVIDDQGRLVDFNPSAQAIFGIGPNDLWNPALMSVLKRVPEIAVLLADPSGKATRDVDIGDKSYVAQRTPLLNNRNLVYGQLVVIHDNTGQKKMLVELQQRDEKFQQLIATAADALILVNTEGRIVLANQQAATLLGYEQDELLRINVEELIPFRFREIHGRQRVSYTANPHTRSSDIVMDIMARHKTGREIPVDIGLGYLNTSEGLLISADIRDITRRKQMEEALRVSQENFMSYFNMGAVGMCVTTPNQNWVEVNDQLCQMLGYSKEELKNFTWSQLTYPDDLHADLELFNQTLRGERDTYQMDKRFIRRDGGILHTSMFVTCQRFPNGSPRYFLASLVDISERVEQEAALRAAQEQLAGQQRAVAVIEERQRLARDLHDSVSQSLHSLNLFSETLASSLEKDNKARALQLAERLQESARQALKEARLMLYQLQPSELEAEADLVREIEARLDSVEERAGVRASLKVRGDARQCPVAWRENLFRITIEALNNSLKHAQARNLTVALRCDDSKVEIKITDDGIGFDHQRARGGGMGLRTMRERAEMLGGTLEVRSSPGAGTSVIVCVRVEKKETP